MTGTQGGLVIGWYSTVPLALSPVAGTLIDRYGARRVILPALLIETVGSGSLALAYSVLSASTALTVLALGSSAVLTAQSVIPSQITEESERQAAFGLQFTYNTRVYVAVLPTATPARFDVAAGQLLVAQVGGGEPESACCSSASPKGCPAAACHR